MIGLTLYWKRDGEDVRLGAGYHDVVPPVGGLLTFPCDHGAVWRVAVSYQHLVMEGSQTWRRWRDGRSYDTPEVTLFVEPAEGPFEP